MTVLGYKYITLTPIIPLNFYWVYCLLCLIIAQFVTCLGYQPYIIQVLNLMCMDKKIERVFAPVFTSFLTFSRICYFRGTPPKTILLVSSSSWE